MLMAYSTDGLDGLAGHTRRSPRSSSGLGSRAHAAPCTCISPAQPRGKLCTVSCPLMRQSGNAVWSSRTGSESSTSGWP
jgi:hypothetical protein